LTAISYHALGLTTRQVQGRLKEIYNADVSPELISRVIDGVKGLPTEWRGRALEPVYPVLFFDALRINAREGPQVVKKPVYLGPGDTVRRLERAWGTSFPRDMDRAERGAEFWFLNRAAKAPLLMGIMNELKKRGLKDTLIAAVDGLTGFLEAITAVFPQAEVQMCIVRMVGTR
jgi:transposase-like protein